jgi:hypothetical protein
MSSNPINLYEGSERLRQELDAPKLFSPAGLVCGLVVVACILACRPFVEAGYIDDWSMARTAHIFAETGHFAYNGWAAMTEGWQILWGALFVRIFGFSYTVVRLSLLPVTFLAIYLFRQCLIQFRFTERRATLGALALGLSPIFLPVATTFMTDIPSLAVIILCLFLCQRAVLASTARATILWLLAAALTNLAGGTVRQTAFLGILVMVPCTGWALRKRRGVLVTAIALTALGGVFILGFIKWYLAQPYSVPERILSTPLTGGVIAHLAGQLCTAFLLLLVAVLPLLGLFFSRLLRLRSFLFWSAGAVLALLLVLVVATQNMTPVGTVLSKFHIHIGLIWLGVMLAVAAVLLGGLRLFVATKEHVVEGRAVSASWKEIFWLLGPYSLAYFALLLPRGAAGWIWDRYLLGLIPLAIVALLKLHQDSLNDRISLTAVVLLMGLAVFGIAKADVHYSQKRALLTAANLLFQDSVPRTAIDAGFEYDCETELDVSGHVNEPKVKVPMNSYRPYALPAGLPPSVAALYSSYAPSVKPQFFILDSPNPFLVSTKYSPIAYTTLLPPFHRFIYIQALPQQ